MTQTDLALALDRIADHEEAQGAKMFMGRPDRWYEPPTWRCPNDHVTLTYLKTEVRGACCLACYEPVRLTFPEDREGPLRHPALEKAVA